MKKIPLFLLLLSCLACQKELRIEPSKDYELKLSVYPVMDQRYRYPIDTIPYEKHELYLVKTIAGTMNNVLADLDHRGYKPTAINYSLNAMDSARDEISKITIRVLNLNKNQFFVFPQGDVTVEFFYWDSTAATLDDRFIAFGTATSQKAYSLVERK